MKCGFISCQEVAVDVFFEKVAGDTFIKEEKFVLSICMFRGRSWSNA